MLNENERDEIDNILKAKDFDIAFFGHTHKNKYESNTSHIGGIKLINARSAFNDSNERDYNYQPGYNILDLDIKGRVYTLFSRKYIKNGYRFDKDTDSLINGQITGSLDSIPNVSLNNNSTTDNPSLPSGYSAHVENIVKLLIGKSLYPDTNVFVRELIQNSVDACNRAKESCSVCDPKIIININTNENYFEIYYNVPRF